RIVRVLSDINMGMFRRFDLTGQRAGHHNFNYPVFTCKHCFNEITHTKPEGYFMWQFAAVKGGTVSIGPPRSFGGGGGIGADIPGTSLTYGTVNYTMFRLWKRGFVTVRNEWGRDEDGEASAFPASYSSPTARFTHPLTPE